RGFAQDADARPQYEQTNGKPEQRIDPASAGGMNEDCTGDDGDVRERVTEVVDQDAAQIQVAAATDERESDAAVHGERGDGSPNHPILDDGDGGAESFDRFVTEPK